MQVILSRLRQIQRLMYMLIKSGKRRKTIVFKYIVLKIPRNIKGLRANWQEFCISLKDRKHYASVFLFFGFIIAERVSELDFRSVTKYFFKGCLSENYLSLKQSLDEIKPYCTESYQIGVDRKGRLKYYDYEYGNI